jgi:hypothetical protein
MSLIPKHFSATHFADGRLRALRWKIPRPDGWWMDNVKRKKYSKLFEMLDAPQYSKNAIAPIFICGGKLLIPNPKLFQIEF